MEYYNQVRQQQIIDSVVTMVETNLADDKEHGLISQFVRFFFEKVSDQDLSDRTASDLYGLAISMWQFFVSRHTATDKAIRIYNPEFERDGWQSSHTVIEIAMPDMPFLMDSIRMELSRNDDIIHLIISPGAMVLERDKNHRVKGFKAGMHHHPVEQVQEVPIYIEINRLIDQAAIDDLKQKIQSVLDDVSLAVTDWPLMQKATQECIEHLKQHQEKSKDVKEALSFLNWMCEGQFTFLGVADYHLDRGHRWVKDAKGCYGLAKAKKYAISIEADCQHDVCDVSGTIWMQQLMEMSTVHRPTRPYCVAVKQYDEHGKIVGERRLYGLFTSVAYHSSPDTIPIIRRKVADVINRAGFDRDDHNGHVLFNILETYPRDELFQSSDDDLFDISLGIMHLQERAKIRLFIRKDYYNRYFSCLVFVPRDRFNSRLREKMSDMLMKAFGGVRAEFMTNFSESILARIHLMIFLPEGGEVPLYDLKALEQAFIEAGRTWADNLALEAVEHFGEALGTQLMVKYQNGFPAGYKEVYTPRTAVHDIEHMEALKAPTDLGMSFYRPLESHNGHLNFKLFLPCEAIPLSEVLPLLENMGFKVMGERSSEIHLSDKSVIWISEFSLNVDHIEIAVDAVKNAFQEAFARIWRKEAESDGFNALVITAGLDWREISLIRSVAKYLRQIGFHFSQSYIETTLKSYTGIVKNLMRLFNMTFDPNVVYDDKGVRALQAKVLEEIDAVTNLDQDRILRAYLSVGNAIVRTNYFQRTPEGGYKDYISFKLKSSMIPDVPQPYPAFEIFVYSPRVEGVHLRGAKVARGGLRWSDRREDFRTEVLGLMKAQQVKNAVIVPAGAKGGFVPKQMSPQANRDEIMAEGIACYKIFIRGLLDLTDNRVGDKIVGPENVRRRDEDDPYLVVAADKGTATFSDIANSVSAEYKFWLGDAFASGGSQGYDHKKMGITARGAWESVKRHFRELNRDIQTQDFTVVGIGDMAGDVFGNGLLQSKHIKLIAAFNHMHIFLDPNPDAALSFKERERMFNLPRSAWSDYDPKLISKGGGVYLRSVKAVPISPEVAKALGITDTSLSPSDLIRAILKSPVDLLWNGGIGTYVKATTESNSDVGDRTNDSLRVDGRELRCKVVGEGGNLGFTQLGRVEYSLNEGIMFTDFIDNSGGVDCSDHEVNIKILLDRIVSDGDLTMKQRNELLDSMTDAVGALVLQDNYQQTQALALSAWRSSSIFDEYIRFMQDLERAHLLKRDIEFLPSDKDLAKRRSDHLGFTRPELAILLSYSKISLKQQLLQDVSFFDDQALLPYLEKAFPAVLCQRYKKQLQHHRLRNEIIATQLAGDMCNRMGATYTKRIYDETGGSPANIARSYMVSNEIFDMDGLWTGIQALDGKIPATVQNEMLMLVVRLIRRSTRWFLRNRRVGIDVLACVKVFKPYLQELSEHMVDVLAGEELEKLFETTAHYENHGVPHALAMRVASCRALVSSLDIVEATFVNKLPLMQVAKVYFALGAYLELDWFRAKILAHEVNNNWDALARAACRDDVDRQQRSITESILLHNNHRDNPELALKAWGETLELLVTRWRFLLADLKATTSDEFTMYAVALRELLDLAQSSHSFFGVHPEQAKLS